MISSEELVVRLAVAAILGGLVGLERERLEWAAGMRTHALVSLGSLQGGLPIGAIPEATRRIR